MDRFDVLTDGERRRLDIAALTRAPRAVRRSVDVLGIGLTLASTEFEMESVMIGGRILVSNDPFAFAQW